MFRPRRVHGKPQSGALVYGKGLLAGEFPYNAMSIVDLHEGFHDSVDVCRDGTRHIVPEHEVVVQCFDVSINDYANDFEFLVDDDTPGTLASDVICADEVDGLRHVDPVHAVKPDLWEVEGVLVAELGVATVEPVKRRTVRRDRSVAGEAPNDTVCESKRHRCIGTDLRAVTRQQCATHLSTEGFFLRVELLAEFFVFPHQDDELACGGDGRIFALLNRLPTRFDQRVAIV